MGLHILTLEPTVKLFVCRVSLRIWAKPSKHMDRRVMRISSVRDVVPKDAGVINYACLDPRSLPRIAGLAPAAKSDPHLLCQFQNPEMQESGDWPIADGRNDPTLRKQIEVCVTIRRSKDVRWH